MFKNINWILVYTAEAHAIDEWPISSARYSLNKKPIIVTQTRNITDRCVVAQKFVNEYEFTNWKLLIAPPAHLDFDNLHYNFETIYKPWPFRIYGFTKLDITFASEPRSCETRIEELRDWLERNT